MKKLYFVGIALFLGIIGCISINSTATFAYNGYKSGTKIEGSVVEGFDWLYIENGPYVTVKQKVFVDTGIDRSIWSDTVELYFESTSSDDSFVVYLKDVDTDNPYFIVPDTAKDGERYILKSLNLFSDKISGGGSRVFSSQYIKEDDQRIYIDVHGSVSEIDDNIGKLNSFKFKSEKVSLNDNIYLNLSYTGDISFMTVKLKNENSDLVIERYVNDYWTDSPYINLSSLLNVTAGTYMIKEVSLCTSYNYENTCNSYDPEYYYDEFGPSRYIIIYDEESDISLREIDILTNDTVTAGSKVEVNISADREISNALLVFSNISDESTFSVYVKDINENGYFLIPSIVDGGEYRIQSIVIRGNNGSSQVISVPNFDTSGYIENGITFNRVNLSVFSSNDEESDSFVFNNEDFSETIINKIKKLSSTAVITVICDDDSILSEELFSSIMETRKTLIVKYMDSEWIFNGKNIVLAKPIDVSIFVNNLSDSNLKNNELFDKIDNDRLFILDFKNNGDLPGKTLIRLKSSDLDYIFGGEDVYVYYYDDDTSELLKVAMEVQKSDGYYEFYINHNSSYVITSDMLDDTLVSDDDTYLNLNVSSDEDNSSNNVNNSLLLIAIGACLTLILVLIVVIFVMKSKNKKSNL